MIKVKTFASPLKIFHARKEIEELDTMVNKFIEEKKVRDVIISTLYRNDIMQSASRHYVPEAAGCGSAAHRFNPGPPGEAFPACFSHQG